MSRQSSQGILKFKISLSCFTSDPNQLNPSISLLHIHTWTITDSNLTIRPHDLVLPVPTPRVSLICPDSYPLRLRPSVPLAAPLPAPSSILTHIPSQNNGSSDPSTDSPCPPCSVSIWIICCQPCCRGSPCLGSRGYHTNIPYPLPLHK